MIIRNSGEPVGDAALTLFERFLEINLPRGYRRFCLEYNGGRPEPNCFVCSPSGEGSLVQCFYRFNSSNNYDDMLWSIRIFKERMPQSYLPIGCDPFGNQICLVVKGQNYGQVFFWDHEFETDDGCEPTEENLTRIASDFDAFLDSLHEFQE